MFFSYVLFIAPAYGLAEALHMSRQEGGSYIRAIDRLIERAETFVDKVIADALESSLKYISPNFYSDKNGFSLVFRYEEQRREYLISHEKIEALLKSDTSRALWSSFNSCLFFINAYSFSRFNGEGGRIEVEEEKPRSCRS